MPAIKSFSSIQHRASTCQPAAFPRLIASLSTWRADGRADDPHDPLLNFLNEESWKQEEEEVEKREGSEERGSESPFLSRRSVFTVAAFSSSYTSLIRPLLLDPSCPFFLLFEVGKGLCEKEEKRIPLFWTCECGLRPSSAFALWSSGSRNLGRRKAIPFSTIPCVVLQIGFLVDNSQCDSWAAESFFSIQQSSCGLESLTAKYCVCFLH